MRDFPRTAKHLTFWLVLITAGALGVQAWQARQQAARFQATLDGEIVLRRADDGHYHWPGRLNGRPVDFLVDTGATTTTVPEALVRDLPSERSVLSSTAGGTVRGRVVRVDLALDGGVQAGHWRVTALPDLRTPLLGMDVLGRMHYHQADGVLRLQRPAAR